MENLETYAVVARPAFSVVVPVRNEAQALTHSVPALLTATSQCDVRIIWVCNGCTDDSADVIRALAPEAEIIELEHPGKTRAMQAADDRLKDLFPRVYMDADFWIGAGDLSQLVAPLQTGEVEMTGPVHKFEMTGVSWAARAVAGIWQSLPHAQQAAFTGAIGLSAAGRARWDRFPDLMGDDIFMSSVIAPERKRIVAQVEAHTAPPIDLRGWVAARRRWYQGERELAALGQPRPTTPGQRKALVKRLLHPRTCLAACLFVAVRILARYNATQPGTVDWQPDRPK